MDWKEWKNGKRNAEETLLNPPRLYINKKSVQANHTSEKQKRANKRTSRFRTRPYLTCGQDSASIFSRTKQKARDSKRPSGYVPRRRVRNDQLASHSSAALI
ncbi:hypothetical protein Trydic_g9211 [Trypoxylus dichotomus]